ncbi:hypothetical protein C9374_003780 [Naegleria lovaniensis]|uniref:C5orf34-like C-terminal domain-containing protein n=1 Tax=Naegleria lovaniensis TaxID=51637 RepID=A0AA88H849_NAELO|nr:uncharacterized protein C9374_003780 [Naegleria lovaniensis]KAG2394016.1 hypothetical protein C9374_003780 [Naegleria lovaniensis]
MNSTNDDPFPSLLRAILFRNEDCLGVFSDRTAILLCEEASTFYYFSNISRSEDEKEINEILGEKSSSFEFQLTAFVQNKGKEQIKFKLNQILMFFNCHVESPYLSDQVLIQNGINRRTFNSQVMMSTVQWKYNSDYVSFNRDGSVTLRCVTYPDYVYITVAPNGVLFKVTFPALVHSRNQDLYQYILQDQLFSIHYYPSEWEDALKIALFYFKQRTNRDDTPVNNEHTTTMSVPKTKPPFRKKDSTPTGINISSLACVVGTIASHPLHQSCVSFLTCCLGKNNNVLIEFNEYMTMKYLRKVTELILNKEEYCFLSDNTTFLKYWTYDHSFQKPISKVYDINLLPQEIYRFCDNNVGGVKIESSIPIKDLLAVMHYFYHSCSKVDDNTKQVDANNTSDKYSSVLLAKKTFNNIGSFEMYADKRVRAKFDDRTIVEIQEKDSNSSLLVSILSSTAEISHFFLDKDSKVPMLFRRYIDVALEFRKECLKTEQEKQQEKKQEIELEKIIQDCYQSNSLFLAINQFKRNQANFERMKI